MQRKDLFLEHVVEVAATTLSFLGSRENCAGDRSQRLIAATAGHFGNPVHFACKSGFPDLIGLWRN